MFQLVRFLFRINGVKFDPLIPSNKGIAIAPLCIGRGHITQAITIIKLLQQHRKVNLVICNQRDLVPQYFIEFLRDNKIDLVCFPDCGIVVENGKTLFARTLWNLFIGSFRKDPYFAQVNRLLVAHQIGTVINLYDCLFSIYYYTVKPKIKMISIAPQYKEFLEYPHPYTSSLVKNGIIEAFRTAAYNTQLRFTKSDYRTYAISPLPPLTKSTETLRIIPPLIDGTTVKEDPHPEIVLNRTKTVILAYFAFPEYHARIMELARNPNYDIHLFRNQNDEILSLAPNLTTYSVSYARFHYILKRCDVILTTSGTETLCEGIQHHKYIIITPIAHHYEQETNSLLYPSNLFNIRCSPKLDPNEVHRHINELILSNHRYDNEYDSVIKYYNANRDCLRVYLNLDM